MIKGLRNKTSMSHSFSRIPQVNTKRSTFNRRKTWKGTFDSGKLIPIFVDEVLPGDTFNVSMTAVTRLATPIVPYMDNLWLDYFFFFVPNRLIWDNWVKFMGEQDNPGDSTDFVVPQMPAPVGGFARQCMSDYFGIPPAIENISVNSLHHRAYNLIYNEFFRDENLQDAVPVDKDDGPDDASDYICRRRGKRRDYITSCLPWPQKGDTVDLPLGVSAPIIASQDVQVDTTTIAPTWTGGNLTNVNLQNAPNNADWSSTGGVTGAMAFGTTTGLRVYDSELENALTADLTNATAATINSLREAFQLQRMLERDARGGTRYVEHILAHFGVTNPDFRLQRPEYLGGGRRPVDVDAIPQTSETSGSPQGTLTGVGYNKTSGIGFTKSFTEHGVLIGLTCAIADLSYQDALHRMWTREIREDFFYPALQFLGEQAVLNSEVYLQDGTTDTGGTGTPDNERVWGYQERWSEYRYGQNIICGKLRSDDPQSLDVWHLAQDFSSLPALNSDFIEENPPVSRVIATTDEPEFIMDSVFVCNTTRPMPTFSPPGMIDHF